MKVKELARILNGIDGSFDMVYVDKVTIDYRKKLVRFGYANIPEPKPEEKLKAWDEDNPYFPVEEELESLQ